MSENKEVNDNTIKEENAPENKQNNEENTNNEAPKAGEQTISEILISLGFDPVKDWGFQLTSKLVIEVITENPSISTDEAVQKLIILDPNAKVELVRERVKMVLVARSDLKMGAGKLGAQCGHAAVDVVIKVQPPSPFYPLFVEWQEECGGKKVVLRVNSEEKLIEIYKTAKGIGLPCTIIADAGLTQIASGSRTVVGILGYESDVNSVTGKLPLY